MPNVVVITGASGGIGLAACKSFIARGDRVYGLCRKPFELDGAVFIPCDVTDKDAVIAAVSRITEQEDCIDILIANAGYGIAGSVEFTPAEDVIRQFDVNVVGAVNTISAVLPTLRKHNGGRIIITSSLAAVLPIPFQSFYSMTKAALNALALSLRNEVRPYHIEVSALMPGDIKTGFTSARTKSFVGQEAYPVMSHAVSVMEHDEQNGMNPSRIARKLIRISTARHPRPLYTCGAKYHLFAFLCRVLPSRLVCWIVGKLYS